ncbi:MAG: hypothetical protein QOD30_1694, partial [Actinomycetota bacterium]|nr:hypothetical protein [Actinomycetota bacterium]
MRHRPLAVLLLGALIAGLAAVPSAIGRDAPSPTDVLSMISVDAPTRAARQRLVELGLDSADHSDPTHVALVVTAADMQRLRAAGFTYRVDVPDLARREVQRIALDAAYAAAADTKAMPSGRKAYRSLADYDHDLHQLAVENPGLVKLIALPAKTLEGRIVHGIEITDQVQAKDAKPVFVLLGVHHAREWPSGEHAIELAYDLVNTWRAGDVRTHDLLGRARVIVVPVVNPDGYDVSFESAKIADGRELQNPDSRGDGADYVAIQQGPQGAYKRKNCRMIEGQDTPSGSCMAPGSRYLGVDDNRNYGALWGGAGASSFPGDDIYRGAAPFSEPETQNIRTLISHRQVTMMVTQHTFAGLVLHAPGVKDQGVTADEPALADVGARMAAANGSISEAGYQLYDTTGTTEDWSYSATGGFGYTFELPVREFHPPYAETVDEYYGTGKTAGRGNREALYIALTTAADRRYHSVIAADAPKGAVLRLQKSFETTTSPVRSNETQFTSDDTAGPPLRVRDSLDTTTLSTGHVEWHVNPSTRPAVMERKVYDVAATPARTFTTSGTAPAAGQ